MLSTSLHESGVSDLVLVIRPGAKRRVDDPLKVGQNTILELFLDKIYARSSLVQSKQQGFLVESLGTPVNRCLWPSFGGWPHFKSERA